MLNCKNKREREKKGRELGKQQSLCLDEPDAVLFGAEVDVQPPGARSLQIDCVFLGHTKLLERQFLLIAVQNQFHNVPRLVLTPVTSLCVWQNGANREKRLIRSRTEGITRKELT